MKKDLWDATFHRHRFPAFPCPRCGDGRVKLNSDSLSFLEPPYSKLLHDDPDFEPGWDTVVFTCFFQCDDHMCGEIITMIGDQVVYEDFDEESLGGRLFQFMRPRAIFPAPHIIKVTEKLAEEPRAHLVKSFELFWTDTGSCANKLRVFLESLLTQLQVPKKGTLAERITEYEKKSPGNQPLFDALRHVGNTASHDGQVERDALLHCYQILEHILDQVLDKKIANLMGLAAQLAKHKGKKPSL